MSGMKEAVQRYFASRWPLYEIEVLAHHFVSPTPFARDTAPGYPVVIGKLRGLGLMEPDSYEVTALGVEFIASLCETEIPTLPTKTERSAA